MYRKSRKSNNSGTIRIELTQWQQAVTELDGRVFNGNNIIPKFYDTEDFERGIYTGK